MFVGREKEIQKIATLSLSGQSHIGVLYGRRRIGKSALIRESLKGKKVLLFEGLEEQGKTDQLRNFSFQFCVQTGKKIKKYKTWSEAFYALYQFVEKNPHHIVFDEFQWMANYRSGIVSELKMIWDQYLSHVQGTVLLLCGSIASFMIKKVVRSKALYGRTTLTIHLQGFSLSETQKMLGGKGCDETVQAYMLVGGVPKYLELLAGSSSIEVAMRELAFSPNGYLVEEFDRIFTSHFGASSEYQAILDRLARSPYGLFRNEIASAIGCESGGRLTSILYNLESAGFISHKHPFHSLANSKKSKYFLTDPYLRFYFEFIKPTIHRMNDKMEVDLFAEVRQTGAYYAWQGRSFEYLCMEHAHRIVQLLGFSGIKFEHGPFFESSAKNKKGVQIDLVFNRADHVITLCEMKYSLAKVGKDVIDEVERKSEWLREKFPKKTIQKVLITKEGASSDLLASGYFYKVIEVEQLFDDYPRFSSKA